MNACASWTATAVAAGILAAVQPALAGTLLGSTRAGEIIEIDQTTGAATLVCPDQTGGVGATEIELDNGSGAAFLQHPDGAFSGRSLDIGTCTVGAPVSNGHSFTGLEFLGGALFGVSIDTSGGPSSLRALNPGTGVSLLIGATGVAQISGLAFAGVTLYGIGGGAGPANLYTIDLGTGVATVVGSTGMQAGSLEFGDGGRLFAGGTGGNSGELWEIDPATGAGTLIGPTGFTNVTGLALRRGVDHFNCYKAKTAKATPKFVPIQGVSLDDQFGARTMNVQRPVALCNPVNKNGEDPSAPGHPEHEQAYLLKSPTGAPKFNPVTNLEVVNQFGTIRVDAMRPDRLLLPTAKSLIGPTPPFATWSTDHFQCYKAKITKGTPKFVAISNVSLVDQLGSMMVDVKKPSRLCNPVNKNGEDPTAPTHVGHLMCYQAKPVKGAPKFTKVTPIYVSNQFTSETLEAIKPEELCVPSLKNPVCGNGVLEAIGSVGEQCDDGNTTSGDGCSSTCVREFCGDGIVQAGLGEQCEAGNDGACPGQCISSACVCGQPSP